MTEKIAVIIDRVTQARSFQMPISALGLDETADEDTIRAAAADTYLNEAMLTTTVTTDRTVSGIMVKSADPETEPFDELKLEQYELIYRDTTGVKHYQPVADLTEVGTLIDPETGDDMELIALRRAH